MHSAKWTRGFYEGCVPAKIVGDLIIHIACRKYTSYSIYMTEHPTMRNHRKQSEFIIRFAGISAGKFIMAITNLKIYFCK